MKSYETFETYNHTKNSDIEYYYSTRIDYKNHETKTIEKQYPLGYTLFTIIESLDYIIEDNKKDYDKVVVGIRKKYYENDFFNTFLLNHYSNLGFTDRDLDNLMMIKHFLDICSNDSKYCSMEYLLVLTSSQILELKPLTQSIGFPSQKGNLFKLSNADNIKKVFDNYEKDKSKSALFYSREYIDLADLCIASLQCIFNDGYIIKKCENCGRYFIPYNRSDTIYCDRNSPQDDTKTCKEYGALQAYKEKLKTDTAAGLYRAIYMQKQMLLRRNPDIKKYEEDFENYKKQTKLWKIDVKNGVKTSEDFVKWLKSIKSQKAED